MSQELSNAAQDLTNSGNADIARALEGAGPVLRVFLLFLYGLTMNWDIIIICTIALLVAKRSKLYIALIVLGVVLKIILYASSIKLGTAYIGAPILTTIILLACTVYFCQRRYRKWNK